MKTLYIDCSNGISGDMLRKAFEKLAGIENSEKAVDHHLENCPGHDHGDEKHMHEDVCGSGGHIDHDHIQGDGSDGHIDNSHIHGDEGHSHRSYTDVQKIIKEADRSQAAKDIALRIYEVIADAEASVHEATLETVRFHEVGRDGAIENALAIGEALLSMGFGKDEISSGRAIIIASPICDGNGFVDCAHGRIPVPVPAVRAMMDRCGCAKAEDGVFIQEPDGARTETYPNFEFKQLDEVKTEMVTPSGLASLIGIGARPAGKICGDGPSGSDGASGSGCTSRNGGTSGGDGPSGSDRSASVVADYSGAGGMMFMEGQITGSAEVTGTRDTGRGGLRIYLIEK